MPRSDEKDREGLIGEMTEFLLRRARVTDPNDIRNAAVLVAAGLIEAAIPHEGDSPAVPAVVVRITPMGRRALHRMHAKQT